MLPRPRPPFPPTTNQGTDMVGSPRGKKDEAGLIASIRAEARARTVNGGWLFAPWHWPLLGLRIARRYADSALR
jgi:hypothetical protein